MPAFMRYDRAAGVKFPISRKKSVNLSNQNSLLGTYKGGIGGKIGWTSAAGATYVGMARRRGVTLIVALLHCPALTEINAGKSLLNWGFAADGKVRPVGTLVGARPPAAPAPPPSPPSPPGHPVTRAARSRPWPLGLGAGRGRVQRRGAGRRAAPASPTPAAGAAIPDCGRRTAGTGSS